MNYTKIAGQFVCKMAMPLALMFAACSTDDGNGVSKTESGPGVKMGGSSEEPRIIASLMGRAYYAPASRDSVSLENIDASFSQDVFWMGGSITLKELDSTTMEPAGGASYTVNIGGAVEDSVTGAMVSSNDGIIRFDSLSLNSPVVMLIASTESVSLETILDLRDSSSFVIDALSHLTAYRIKKLVVSGKSFAEAKNQAETEMAAVFGLDDFDSSEALLVRNELNELSFALLQQMKSELGVTGSIEGLSADSKENMRNSIIHSRIMQFLQLPEAVFERLGDDAVQFYQECLRKTKYQLHMLASVYGYTKCSSMNEGALVDVSDVDFKLKCRDGSWELYSAGAEQLNVDPVLGTMIDSRDGQAYKTVTYNFDGVSQTWMAENLNYATEKSSCYRGDSSYCPAYGRLYTLFPLDSIYNKYASEEACVADRMEVWTAEYRAAVGSELSETDSLYFVQDAHRLCKELEEDPENPDRVNWSMVIDSLEVLGFDVCPEGWRMPTYEDWLILLDHVNFGLLTSAYGNVAGFGLETYGTVRGKATGYRVSIRSEGIYLFTPRLTPEEMLGPGKTYVGDAIGEITKSLYDDRLDSEHVFGLPGEGFVRCIKDE